METRRDAAEPPRALAWTSPWPGARVIWKQSTSSTMDDARALAASGSPTGTVAVAGFQEKGRGRVPGRTWLSPPGESLLATVLLRIPEMGFPLAELPLRAGVAAAIGMEEASGVPLQIKWPNDVVAGGRKLCGLLCEANAGAAFVGIGVNLHQQSFPEEIATTACSLVQVSGRRIEPPEVLEAILRHLHSPVADWRTAIRDRLYKRDERVRVSLLGSAEVVEGILRDIDNDGRLLVDLDGGGRRMIPQGELLTSP